MPICPACAQENPDGFRLCGMCGTSLSATVPTVREERKVVTVLFTDLVGFTSRAEQLDPEDVRATLSPYYARLRDQIEQRGGTVEKFIGDAVMAVFGAPVSHEDDPERAVRTALAIREAIRELNEAEPGLKFQIRTAVNTGEALVALDARPSEGDAMASGDVVNTAARLQTAAPIDGILVGEATYRATRNLIDYREAAPVEAKGKTQPILVWEALAARSRFGIDVEERLRSPLVGRERELALLNDAFARCRREQTAQLVTLVGVPGIGKSRLVVELFQALDNDPELFWWRQGRSLPYGESQSFWALGEIVKAQAGILETDDARAAETKLAATLADLVPDAEERRWVESHLRPLVGVAGAADESGDRRAETFSAWRRVLEALAEQRPLVLVFEDLHWADDGLLDFVDHLAEWVAGVPMLLVATARPELLDRRAGWGGGKRNATTLSIGALSEEETTRLLASLLDQLLLPADVQTQVLRLAEGNPLYAEEYVRMLEDRGFLVRGPSGWQLAESDELPLPETVQGMIAARLDALTPAEKELIQDASVVGKVFWSAALAAIGGVPRAAVEQPLHALERKEFVRRNRRSAVAGELQYAFLHLLVRDVAYGQIPRARRVEKHRSAAAWIESLTPDRSEDHAEMLAHHYREALALAEAAGVDTGPLRGPARRALADASERAAALNAWATAEEFAEAALELTARDDPLRPHLQLRIARAQTFRGRPDADLVAAARDGFLEHGAFERAGESEALLSWVSWWRGDGAASSRHSAHALELVRDLPLSVPKLRAYAQAARQASLAGETETAIDLARKTFALADALGHDELASHALNTLGMARMRAGEIEGLADLERSVELADRSNAPDEIIKSRNNLANSYWVVGRLDDATAHWSAAREAALRSGSGPGLLWQDEEMIEDLAYRGEFAEVVERADELIAKTDDGDQVNNAAHLFHARAFAMLGRVAEGLAESKEALVGAREVANPQHLAPALAFRAFALFAAGHAAEADAVADELLADVLLRPYLQQIPDLPLLLAEHGRGTDYAAAAGHLPRFGLWQDAAAAVSAGEYARAAEVYGAIGAPFHEAWAYLLAAENGEDAELERARAFFARQGATLYLRRCEVLLPASA